MDSFRKVNGVQLYNSWKNLTIAMVAIMVTIALSYNLPAFLSPVVSLLAAAALYTMVSQGRANQNVSCMLIPYCIFISLIVYCFASIIINLLSEWHIIKIPEEFNFFHDPYIPSLQLIPVCFLTMISLFFRHRKLSVCRSCRHSQGDASERGVIGALMIKESHFQMKNLIGIFGALSAIIWTYYLVFYVNISQNSRDWYIFVWLTVIFFLGDIIYFIYRYYNLYLDFKDSGAILSKQNLDEMRTKSFVRFYVICGEKLFCAHKEEVMEAGKIVINTPFFYKRDNFETRPDAALNLIKKKTGIDDGELRYFYGKQNRSIDRYSIIRYFYFIEPVDGEPPHLDTEGEWIDFNKIKEIYTKRPAELGRITALDISRLATIILTSKLFDEDGNHRYKIRSYQPSFTLADVRNSDLDFEDDKWIKVSQINSDSLFFRLKKKLFKLSKSGSGS